MSKYQKHSGLGDVMRQLILEALTLQPGSTRDELTEYLRGDANIRAFDGNLNHSVGQVLRFLRQEQKIKEHNNLWYLHNSTAVPAPVNGNRPRPFSANGNGAAPTVTAPVAAHTERVEISDYYATRTGYAVSLERSPLMLEGVIHLEAMIGDNWIPLPVFGDVRLCIGTDIPKWTPQQEVLRGVSAVRVTHRNGEREVHNLDKRNPLTIAPILD